MYKKNLKFLLNFLLILITIFSLSTCFAETDTANTTTEDTSSVDDTNPNPEQEIHNGDLYLFDNKIVMNKLVDGNVFIFGQDVEITGQVNGNLFVFANKLNFNNCYIKNTIFACATNITYNGACNDLYVASSNLDMTYESYVVRDVKAVSANIILKAAIGRDVDLVSNKVSFGEAENVPIIYGNLRYSSNSEATIPDGVITEKGTATYSKLGAIPKIENIGKTIFNKEDLAKIFFNIVIVIEFLICIVTALVVYILIKACTPKLEEKLSNENLKPLRILTFFVFGIVTFILVIFVCTLLLLTSVGIKLAFILALLFILICLVSVPIFTIIIAKVLSKAFKIQKKILFYLILALVNIILYGLTLIPYVGIILSIIIKLISIGIIINIILPKKEIAE